MSCDYCWPGNCCGGPNCGKRVDPGKPSLKELYGRLEQAQAEVKALMNEIDKQLDPPSPRVVVSNVLKDDFWFKLPLTMRQRWWRETGYNKLPPSDALLKEAEEHYAKSTNRG